MSLVSFVKVKTESDTRRAIEDSLDLIEYKLPTNIENIAIKPNMCYYWDFTTGQTTDPKFIATIIELLQDKISSNVNISIIESDASAMKCKYAFKMLGYEKMIQHYKNVRLVNLSEDEADKIQVTVRGENLSFTLPRTIRNADLRINVPKIKYLSRTKITCALKNIYGCNPHPEKFRYHKQLDKAIVGLNKIMKFNLGIIDGIIVSGASVHKLNLVMASRDLVALDAAASKIAGVNPRKVKHIILAQEEGLGRITFSSKGTDTKFFESNYPRQSLTYKAMATGYKLAMRSGLLSADMI